MAFQERANIRTRTQITAFLLVGIISAYSTGLPQYRKDQAKVSEEELKARRDIEEEESTDIFDGARCGVPTIVRKEEDVQKRIVGGIESLYGEWPWLATLQLYNSTSNTYQHMCGGTLIHPQWVISVAHCFEHVWAPFLTLNSSHWRVRLGEHNLFDDAEKHVDVDVEKIILHPKRQAHDIWAVDIALLKLVRPVKMDKYVNLACVPLSEDGFKVGQMCQTIGWGHTQEGGKMSPILRHVSVPVITSESCIAAYREVAIEYNMTMDDDVLCAGNLGEGGKDACQYDSGGPMMCKRDGRYYIYGLVSTGYGCARSDYPGVYTRVTSMVPWVTQIILTN